jgi:hypothetical protein
LVFLEQGAYLALAQNLPIHYKMGSMVCQGSQKAASICSCWVAIHWIRCF